MATTAIIPVHVGKGRTVAAALGLSTDYIKNPEKTDGGVWVTAYECSPSIVDQEFMFSKRQYAVTTGRDQGASNVIAYHLRISFKPGETDAATANRIGYDLAMKLTRGNHAFVCCTHVDKVHTHSHIVFNSTSLCATKKFRNFKGSAFAIRRIADYLCIENGLSIVTNPKPSQGSYGKWQGDNRPLTNREKLERMIDTALEKAKDFDGFLAAMTEVGCEVKRGKNLAFKIPGADRFARCKSLGEDYTEDAIMERLRGLRKVIPKTFQTPKINLVIDLQQKLEEGKSTGYLNWAKSFNLKQAAKALIYLQENNLLDYDLLTKTVTDSSVHYHQLLKNIKADEGRMKEIKELQKYIGQYRKTRETYKAWLASKRDPNFYEYFREDISLHQAAKNYFDSLGYNKNKPLPKMDALKQEYAKLVAGLGKQYADYKQAKQKMSDLQITKQNVDWILDGPIYPTKTHQRGTHVR